MYTVYAIRVPFAGKVYFGTSGQLPRRWKKHLYLLGRGNHHCMNLQAWYDQLGRSCLVFEVLVTGLEKKSAHALEEKLMRTAVALNIGLHAVGGDNLTRHPGRMEILRRRVATQAAMIAAMTEQERKALWGRDGELNGMFGRTHTAEARQRIGAAHAGNSYAKGLKWSAESRARLSVVASQRVGGKNSFYGRNHSADTKARLSASRHGVKPANSRPVICDGVAYPSATEASRRLGVVPATILFRIKSKHWNYSYA